MLTSVIFYYLQSISSANLAVKSYENKLTSTRRVTSEAAALETLALKNTEILALKKSISEQTEKARHYESISVERQTQIDEFKDR